MYYLPIFSLIWYLTKPVESTADAQVLLANFNCLAWCLNIFLYLIKRYKVSSLLSNIKHNYYIFFVILLPG